MLLLSKALLVIVVLLLDLTNADEVKSTFDLLEHMSFDEKITIVPEKGRPYQTNLLLKGDGDFLAVGEIIGFTGDFFGPIDKNYMCLSTDFAEQIFQKLWSGTGMMDNKDDHLIYLATLRMAYAKEYGAMFGGDKDWLTEEDLNNLKNQADIGSQSRQQLLQLQDPMVFDQTIQNGKQNLLLFSNMDHFNTCAEKTWKYFYNSAKDIFQSIKEAINQGIKSNDGSISKSEQMSSKALSGLGSQIESVNKLLNPKGSSTKGKMLFLELLSDRRRKSSSAGSVSFSSLSGSEFSSISDKFKDLVQMTEVPELVKKQYEAYGRLAFGAHFLTDQFSAGHILTPRASLVKYCFGLGTGGKGDVIGHSSGNAMHDEMNANGLPIKINGNPCFAKGDSFLFKPEYGCKKEVRELMPKYFNTIYQQITTGKGDDFQAVIEWDQENKANEKVPCPLYLTNYHVKYETSKMKTIDCSLFESSTCQIFMRRSNSFMPQSEPRTGTFSNGGIYNVKVGSKYCYYDRFTASCVTGALEDCCINCCFKSRVSLKWQESQSVYKADGSFIAAAKVLFMKNGDIGKNPKRREPSSETMQNLQKQLSGSG